ncbi:hypothetical protein C3941_23615 [Kaistia algarum]|uniref:helix-turn-helix domain-containing protein n=1 Tax=Kaistia algarum TaxID=2083279 RepID=UPI000CE7EFA5|nr:helix-turn-helix transcriptional regulator [Kaistia algarum]MCX5513454.1 helix-turn-helix transcriptional regulator [Kaistia algarum]PPE77448.1 hypothetical protein C3941_23615 [Kaistia algarum]
MSARSAVLTASIPAQPVRGLSREQAAAYIGVSVSSFDKMIEERTMPAPKTWHTRKLWDVRALDRAFDALPGSGEVDGEWNFAP